MRNRVPSLERLGYFQNTGLAQTRDTKQTVLDGIAQVRDNALAVIRDINVRMPHVIENNLDPDDELVGDLNTVYAIQPGVSEASDLNLAHKLVSLWTSPMPRAPR